jgi:hypothetical protein
MTAMVATLPVRGFVPQLVTASTVPQVSLRNIFAPGESCRLGISHETYHSDRSCVSSTGLKVLACRTPAHYRDYLDGPPRKETPALFMGTAIHARVLEPAEFDSRYVIAPISDKRSAEWKEFVAANPGRIPLTENQRAVIEGIAENVFKHNTASELLRRGLKELTVIWQDEETGLWLKIRPDCLCLNSGTCMDLKSAEDADKHAFARACEKYNYDISAAMYLDGLRTVLKRDFDYAFLAAEKDGSRQISLYGASDEMLLRGHRRYREALATLAKCVRENRWPGYQPDGGYEILPWPRYAA